MSVKQMSVWSVLWLLTVAGVPASANAPLADAAEKRNQAQIQRLLEQAVDVNGAQVDGMTALHWTTLHDDLETARLLVEAGADVTVTNRYAVTPLTLACTNGNGPLVELLLEAGAHPNTIAPGGEPVLMTAARTGRLLARRLFGKASEAFDGEYVPTAVFTPREYACVGWSEEEAVERLGDERLEARFTIEF